MNNREIAEETVYGIVVPLTGIPETPYERGLCRTWIRPIELALDEKDKEIQAYRALALQRCSVWNKEEYIDGEARRIMEGKK